MATLPISLDQGMIDQIAKEFDLRAPNKEGLRQLIFQLTGDFDPLDPLVMNMATGAGKTYLMAAAIEYFRRHGIHNVMIVTPSLVVQNKTVQNFSFGFDRYVRGFPVHPEVVSPQSYDAWRARQAGNFFEGASDPSMVYIFNVHQLVAPRSTTSSTGATMDAQRTKIRKFQEDAGSLYEFLRELDDLIVIADESHLYGASAKAFNQALKDLTPAATIGLTASASRGDNVIYRYPLHRAISDGFVKTPVLVFRKSGYHGDQAEERQLRDAMSLLRNKEAAYAAFRNDHPDAPETKPALFVVCANVEHATQTAELLRGPGYASEMSVLQVDNQHDGEETRKMLDGLDNPDSPIRVVVSVDKLKEGWDTKRIAVMCTLRAMASEVLTQQTMGRGLRLPFGTRTGVPTIDQLDILAHTSFAELLDDENILKTFGLDEAVDGELSGEELAAHAQPQPKGTDYVPSSVERDMAAEKRAWSESEPDLRLDGGAELEAGDTVVTIKAVELEDSEEIELAPPVDPLEIRINPAFEGTTFQFPTSTMEETIAPFRLSEVHDHAIQAAARRVRDTGEVLQRQKLVASESDSSLKTERIEDAQVASAPVNRDDVVRELTRRVLGLRQVTKNQTNVAQLQKRIIPEFMEASPIAEWTEKAKDSAVSELETLILQAVREHASSTRTEITIRPVRLPIDQKFTLPVGEDVRALLEEDQQPAFQVRRFYGEWSKGLFPVATFDSWSGEYLLALMLNYSSDIVWWKRLYRRDGASIAYSTRDNYYPDFVALDREGIHWIIEGKSDRGVDDETVQRKKDAAVSLVNELISHPDFDNTAWGYLIAYESDVKSAESWADLKIMANPSVTKRYTH